VPPSPPSTPSSDSYLSAGDLEALRAAGRRRRFPRGSILVLEGSDPEEVLLLESGRVKVGYETADGREVLLAVRGPGAVLGELSALDGEPRVATVTAIEDVEATTVSVSGFHEFLRRRPDATLGLLRTLTRRLRESDRKRVEFAAWDTVGRVARLLLELAAEHGEELAGGGVRINLPLSQQELAAWTASSREAVNKALRALRARGWVTTHRRAIVILDVRALQRRSAG
jgi:CRP/FNR family transcriptional regulator, cyclic AMP receptor protein